MPSSNTPSDLKTVIIRALDAACTNASDENSNDCLSRSFANIKELPHLLFQCATLATAMWTRSANSGTGREQVPCFFIFPV
jgi:hypothetical protein